MTIERLIKELKKQNPKAVVKLHNRLGEPVLFVKAISGDNGTVWLDCESDNDIKNEIKERFHQAAEIQMDELDFYMDMLETGIDVEMVRKYMGDESADHMKDFCEEHGLI